MKTKTLDFGTNDNGHTATDLYTEAGLLWWIYQTPNGAEYESQETPDGGHEIDKAIDV